MLTQIILISLVSVVVVLLGLLWVQVVGTYVTARKAQDLNASFQLSALWASIQSLDGVVAKMNVLETIADALASNYFSEKVAAETQRTLIEVLVDAGVREPKSAVLAHIVGARADGGIHTYSTLYAFIEKHVVRNA